MIRAPFCSRPSDAALRYAAPGSLIRPSARYITGPTDACGSPLCTPPPSAPLPPEPVPSVSALLAPGRRQDMPEGSEGNESVHVLGTYATIDHDIIERASYTPHARDFPCQR